MQSGAETDQFTSQAEERAAYKPSKSGVSSVHARTRTDNVQTHRDDVPPLSEARRREFNDGREAKLSPFSKERKNNRTKRKTTKRPREERERNEDDRY
jgi:hypothetical protein